MRVFVAFFLIIGGLAYYLFVYRPAHSAPEVAYALDSSVEIADSPVEVHTVIGKLKQGERVEVLRHTRNWVEARQADGTTGWVDAKNLLDAPTHEAGQRLLKELEQVPTQATGHVADRVNLHIEPSRNASTIMELKGKQQLQVFGRSLVDRPAQLASREPSTAAGASGGREAWYLVRAGGRAGWVLGRLVELDVPEPISTYAQGTNVVAWLVLNTVDDSGRKVAQFLAADRASAPEFDFTRIRVLTWWKQRHRYATAYVEGNLRGYFPIRVIESSGTPSFRLRLVEQGSRKIQKVYGLFDTIVRPLGTVDGWESNTTPTRQALPRNRAVTARRRP